MRIAVVAAAGLLVLGAAHAEGARASIRRTINIPEQDLEPALKTFARDQQLYLIYATADLRALHTHGAVGDLTADQALERLLRATRENEGILLLKTLKFSCRIDDGGRPPGIGVQSQISNRPVRLWFKRSWS